MCNTSNPKQDKALRSEEYNNPFSAHHWSVAVGYRYQHSFRHFVGTTEQTQREIQQTQVVNYINLFDVSLNYSFSPRRSMTLSMPIMSATRTYDHRPCCTFRGLPTRFRTQAESATLVGVTTGQMQQLQLGEAIPATAFFDADGTLVARVLGELNKSDLQHRIDWMLGKHHGKQPPAFVNGFQKKAEPACGPPVFIQPSPTTI